VQLYRYFVSQPSDFCRHNTLCCFSKIVCCCLFRYRLSPETFGYTLVLYIEWDCGQPREGKYFEVFTAVIFQVEVFWTVTPCSVVVGYQRFRGSCCTRLYFTMRMEATWTPSNVGLLPQHYTASHPHHLDLKGTSFQWEVYCKSHFWLHCIYTRHLNSGFRAIYGDSGTTCTCEHTH
jgi:hypothetical protein